MDRPLSALKSKGRIIGVALLVLALGGCSALKLGYRQGPSLAHWWLDDQVGFDDAQSARTKEALARWFDWHRRTQLAPTAALLAQVRQAAAQPVTAEQVCRVAEQARGLAATALDQSLPDALPIVQSLSAAQLQHIERQGRRRLERQRDEQHPADPQRRHEAQLERAIDRAESYYGRLEAGQRQLLDEALRQAPIGVAQSFELRERRQAELLQTLAALTREPSAGGSAAPLERLRAVVRRFDGRDPLLPSLQAAQERHTCALLAQLHNSATPAQRRKLDRQLAGWEADLRSLIADTPVGAAPGVPR